MKCRLAISRMAAIHKIATARKYYRKLRWRITSLTPSSSLALSNLVSYLNVKDVKRVMLPPLHPTLHYVTVITLHHLKWIVLILLRKRNPSTGDEHDRLQWERRLGTRKKFDILANCHVKRQMYFNSPFTRQPNIVDKDSSLKSGKL